MRALPLKEKDLGEFYTPSKISTYLCQNTIFPYLLDNVNDYFGTKYNYWGVDKIAQTFDPLTKTHLKFLFKVSQNLKILDPAVGNGHFLLETMVTLEGIYRYLNKRGLINWEVDQIREYILANNLFGVDINKDTVKECQRRLNSVITESTNEIDHNKILLDLDQHIQCGNSLIGAISDPPQKISQSLNPFNWSQKFPNVMKNGGFDLCLGNPPWNILKPLEKEFFCQYDPRLTKYGVDKRKANGIISKLLEQETIKEQWENYQHSIHLSGKYFRSKEYHYQSDQMLVANKKKTISGDLNLYKLFLERFYLLTKPNGYCGIIIPSGFHTDAGTKGLRRLLFEKNEVKELYSFENKKGIFPTIHRSFKFDLLIFKKVIKKTRKFKAAFMLRDSKVLKRINSQALSIDWEVNKHLSPSSWSILEFKTNRDIEIANRMYQHQTIGTDFEDSWNVCFTREFDMTLDSDLFNEDNQGLVIFEGKMIEQYTHQFKRPRYWIEKENVKNKFGNQYHDYKEHRLGFRAVAASTNRRTMIATILPQYVCCGNSIIITKIFDQNKNRLINKEDLFYLCGVFNSFVFDFLLRLKITTNINMFFIYDMPVPRLSRHNEIYQSIVSNVSDVLSKFESFYNQKNQDITSKSSFEHLQKRALIDVLVAKAYGINQANLKYVLSTFHSKIPNKEHELNYLKKLILDMYA
ncbi:MAG: Eco57I restriction-modification methylase domain-containing protein [Candidatus Heimdallarchaeota archaeon]|nr:MAG: Eco57I restriction-modification methylase domain-containing protein [Candidatus Heimdallarchaeota archaeon]